MLTNRKLLLLKNQVADNIPATLTSADATLVNNAVFTTDVKQLERNIQTPFLGTLPSKPGRILATIEFEHEARGNGLVQSGDLADEPKLGRLFQACGLKPVEIENTAASRILDVFTTQGISSPAAELVEWDKDGLTPSTALKAMVEYTITVSAGGTTCTVISNNILAAGPNATGVAFVSGTPIELGTSGLEVVPNFSTAPVAGDTWTVPVAPVGIVYRASSEEEDMKPLTMKMFIDGNAHEIEDAKGTFTVEAPAGGYTLFKFRFTGTYLPTTAVSIPAGPYAYEKPLPDKTEKASLAWGSILQVGVSKVDIDLGNNIVERPDVNKPEGFAGMRRTEFTPTGMLDPEARPENITNAWSDFTTGKIGSLIFGIGQTSGNRVSFYAPGTQCKDLKYGDRDGAVTNEISLSLNNVKGDDSIFIVLH